MATTSNTALRVSDLDFNSIRNNLKTYLNSQSEFTDYDFEGSGMAVLLDLLAYNTYYNGFYLNMAANEAFLDTAQVRQNILSQAKLVNYIPTSPRGAVSRINVVATPTDSEDSSKQFITLERYTKLLGADIDGVNYPFVTVNSNTAYKDANSFSFANVVIKQGEVITQQLLMTANNTTGRFELPSPNIDTTSIIVKVQESATNTYTEEYFPADNITDLSSDSRAFFIEENENLNYTLQFGDNVLGKRPKNGNIIITTYLDTQGSVANNITKFGFIEPIGGEYSGNVRITTVSKSYGGSDKESLDQIRFRAPHHYVAQNRAVTVTDYESLLLKDFTNIDGISVWGGEDNDPPIYGKVYISLKTKGYYSLSNMEKQNIVDTLISNRNVVTVTPEIIDPNYIFLLVRGRVNYNTNLTSKTYNELISVVKQAILQYAQDELNNFGSTFRKTKLATYIENSDPSITGTDIYVYMQNRLLMTPNINKKYIINFNSPLSKGTFTEKLYTYPQIVVADSQGTSRNVFYEEIPDSYTGVDVIDVISSGTNYTTANVTITGDGTGATAKATIVNGKILSITVTNKGSGYTRATVSFTGDNGYGAVAIPRLQAKNGILRLYYYKDNGEKVIINSTSGTIDYDSGQIVLSPVNPSSITTNNFYDPNILTVNVIPNSEIIPPVRNRILAIDENNTQSIQIEMVAESR